MIVAASVFKNPMPASGTPIGTVVAWSPPIQTLQRLVAAVRRDHDSRVPTGTPSITTRCGVRVVDDEHAVDRDDHAVRRLREQQHERAGRLARVSSTESAPSTSCAQPASTSAAAITAMQRWSPAQRAADRCFRSSSLRPGVDGFELSVRAVRINEHYAKLPASYLFPEIGRRVRAYQAAHPDAKVIRLGIGDVTEPLAPAIVEAMHAAVDEMGTARDVPRLRPRAGLRLPGRRDPRARLHGARRRHRRRRDLRQRRQQVRQRQHPGDLRARARASRSPIRSTRCTSTRT